MSNICKIAILSCLLQNSVVPLHAQNIMSAAQLASDPYCSLLSRRPNGDLLATLPLTNEASVGTNNVLKMRGVDFVFGYETRLGSGDSKIRLSSNVTYPIDYKFNGTDFSSYSIADFGALPHLKANTRLTHSDDTFNVSLNWQYIGKVTETFGGSTTEPDLPKIKSQNYFDLNAQFKVAESFELFGGVQNLLDKQPPLVNSGFAATNTDETLYDPLGRRFFVGAKVSF